MLLGVYNIVRTRFASTIYKPILPFRLVRHGRVHDEHELFASILAPFCIGVCRMVCTISKKNYAYWSLCLTRNFRRPAMGFVLSAVPMMPCAKPPSMFALIFYTDYIFANADWCDQLIRKRTALRTGTLA